MIKEGLNKYIPWEKRASRQFTLQQDLECMFSMITEQISSSSVRFCLQQVICGRGRGEGWLQGSVCSIASMESIGSTGSVAFVGTCLRFDPAKSHVKVPHLG